MSRWPSDAVLGAYLDEALPVDQLAEIEQRLRSDPELRARLQAVIAHQDAGLHSLGVIWRRHRISCPSRDELGQFLLGVLEAEVADYLRFHLEQVGCRYCAANLDDLRAAQRAAGTEGAELQASRRQRYFETSAGRLRNT